MTPQQIPNPYGITWRRFIDTLIGFNSGLQSAISYDDPWQTTAQRIIQFLPLAPQPKSLKTWQDWATALKRAYPY